MDGSSRSRGLPKRCRSGAMRSTRCSIWPTLASVNWSTSSARSSGGFWKVPSARHEECAQRPECRGAVTVRRFQLTHFRQRFPEWRVEKDRIVAKPPAAFRLVGDPPLHGALRFEENVTAPCQRERADK